MPETLLYRGLRSLFGLLGKGSKEVPVIGDAASYYFTKLGEYTLNNMAPSLKYDYTQQAEDVPIADELESAIGKKYKGAGDLGPRSLKSLKKEQMGTGSKRVADQMGKYINDRAFDALPIFLGNKNQLFENEMLDSWQRSQPSPRPVVGVDWTDNRNEQVNFKSHPSQNPNAAFATSGFQRPRRNTKKIYRTVI